MIPLMIVILCCLAVMTIVMVAEIDECRKVYKECEKLKKDTMDLTRKMVSVEMTIRLLNGDIQSLSDSDESIIANYEQVKCKTEALNQWAVKTEIWKQRQINSKKGSKEDEQEAG